MGSEQQTRPPFAARGLRMLGATSALLLLALLTWLSNFYSNINDLISRGQLTLPSPQSTSAYGHLESHCSAILPISQSEFIARQISLAQTLHSLGAAAYIAEPGAYSQFFGNFSKAQWSLSERPLLLIITPDVSGAANNNGVSPQVTVLTPKFETTRAKLLPIPSLNGNIKYIEWAEEADPFAAVLSSIDEATSRFKSATSSKIFVDSGIRKFIVDGLLHASDRRIISSTHDSTDGAFGDSANNISHRQQALQVFSTPPEITQMRERKSEAELQILKCVNEATLLAIREVHKNLAPGIQESHARNMMAMALRAAGLRDGGCLTLFGENAALPHGSGTDRVLNDSDFVLFDCTASLHGYWSDVTRVWAKDSPELGSSDPDFTPTVSLTANSRIPPSHVDIWNFVQKAQQAALTAAKNGTVTKEVDAAARDVFRQERLEQYFTHRLGHGIGLEVHEAPYLRGGSDDIIQVGHTFSDEPGLYIEGEVGVRLEDCFYIDASGGAIYLTDGVGGPSTKPWLP